MTEADRYFEAIKTPGELRGWGLLNIANSYRYGKNGIEQNLLSACSWYEELLRTPCSKYRENGAKAYADLLEEKSTGEKIGVVVAIRFAKTAAQICQEDDTRWRFLRAIVAQAGMNINPWKDIISFEGIEEVVKESLLLASNDHDRADILCLVAHFHTVGCYGFVKSPPKAIGMLREALELDDSASKPFIYRELGTIYATARNYELSKQCYEAALNCSDYSEVRDVNSFFGLIYFNLGTIFLKNGLGSAPLLANAQECCNKAIERHYPRAMELQFAIDQLSASTFQNGAEQITASFFDSL